MKKKEKIQKKRALISMIFFGLGDSINKVGDNDNNENDTDAEINEQSEEDKSYNDAELLETPD